MSLTFVTQIQTFQLAKSVITLFDSLRDFNHEQNDLDPVASTLNFSHIMNGPYGSYGVKQKR